MSLYGIVLRGHRSHILAWGLSILAFMLLIGISYAAVEGNEEYDEIWESMPPEAREAFGGASSLTEVDGYLDSQAVAFLPLILGIGTALLLTRAFAGAEESGSLDHILARPITRTGYFVAQVLAAITIAGVNVAASILGALVGLAGAGVGAGDLGRATAMMLEVVPIYLVIVAGAALAAVLFHRRGPASGAAIGGLFAFFVVDLLGRLVSELDWVKWLSPFGYWAESDLYHGNPDWLYLLGSPVLAAGLFALAAWQFQRKDLYA